MAFITIDEQKKKNAAKLAIKEKMVRDGRSAIFNDWAAATGLSADDFIDGLRWLMADPLNGRPDRPDRAWMTRELGCAREGRLHRLDRVYGQDGHVAFYDQDTRRLWTGSHGPSISCQDRI